MDIDIAKVETAQTDANELVNLPSAEEEQASVLPSPSGFDFSAYFAKWEKIQEAVRRKNRNCVLDKFDPYNLDNFSVVRWHSGPKREPIKTCSFEKFPKSKLPKKS